MAIVMRLISAWLLKRSMSRGLGVISWLALPHVYTILLPRCSRKGWRKFSLIRFPWTNLLMWQTVDASLIANELIDLYARSKTKVVVIKLDIGKTFDIVDWEFLDNIMVSRILATLGEDWVWVVCQQLTCPLLSMDKQSHSWSPFLFTLVVDCLSRVLMKGLDANHIDDFVVRNYGLWVIHVQFHDDTILFSLFNEEMLAIFTPCPKIISCNSCGGTIT